MSLFDYVAPSERAADLSLMVKRVRKRTEAAVVPVLVVEGQTDEPAFDQICEEGSLQVFSAGSRSLVEQLLVHLERDPVVGCECVYLVDCDGYGKTTALKGRSELLVTETCDLEADLVKLGVAARVIARFVSGQAAVDVLTKASSCALPLSCVRRAAHRASVSMKLGGKQLRLCDLPESVLAGMENRSVTEQGVLAEVSRQLGWDRHQQSAVSRELPFVARDADAVLLGKDILDAAFRLIRRDGAGEVRGWSREFFFREIRRELSVDDFASWVVGRRMLSWSKLRGHDLIAVA